MPIVATVAEAAARGAQCLAIGVAPAGGKLPPEWKDALLEALALGMHVEAGLHDELGRDPDLVAAAAAAELELRDVRRVPEGLSTPSGAGLGVPARIVHTVGTDCAIGKMTVTLELTAAARAAGERAVFVPTGQIGISIAGWGIAVDHVIADYVAGAAERLVLEGAERGDLLFVEGQGAILHPLYSGVTLGLLHGSTPHALVLVHEAGAERIDLEDRGGPPGPVIPPLLELADLLLRLTTPLRPAPVVAIALSTRPARDRRGGARGDRGRRGRDRPRLRRPRALRRRAPVARGRAGARMTDPRLERYAQLICEHSLGIDESHSLLIVTPPVGGPLAVATAREAWRRGARVSVAMAPEWAVADVLRNGSDEQVAYLDPAALETVDRFDRWLFVWAPGNTSERAGVASVRDAALARARAPWMARHDEREAAGELLLGGRRVSDGAGCADRAHGHRGVGAVRVLGAAARRARSRSPPGAPSASATSA